MSLSGYLTRFQRLAACYDAKTPSYSNAIFTVTVPGDGVVQDSFGNYVPETPTKLEISAKLYEKTKTDVFNQPGVDMNRIYMEGEFSSQNRPILPQTCPCRLLTNGVWEDGVFNFIFTPTDPFDEISKTYVYSGQKIRGWFARSEQGV